MRYSRLVLNITITGAMLGLVLLMQYLEQFMKFQEVGITINMSLIFIIMTYHLTGRWEYTFLVILLKFAIGPSLDGKGYETFIIWGHVFNIVAFTAATITYILMMKFLLKKNSFIKAFTISAITSIFAVILSLIVFSWFLGNPVYYYLLHITKDVSLSKTIDIYERKDYVRYYFIDNYWLGLAVRNFVSNGAKNIINFLLLFALLKAVVQMPHIELFHARSMKVQNA